VQPLSADVFGIIEHDEDNPSPQTSEFCKEVLGSTTVECNVGERSALINASLLRQANSAVTRNCSATNGDTGHTSALILLHINACFDAVQRAGERRGVPYDVVGRIRSDMLLFEPLPHDFLKEFASNEGAVIGGDQWGKPGDNETTISDNMLVGGADVMRADARVWQHVFRGEHKFCGIAERRQRQTLLPFGHSISRTNLAYCKVYASGACRYMNELRLSSRRIPLHMLLLKHPNLCDKLLERTVCNPSDHDFIQPGFDTDDPNYCNLQQECADNLKTRQDWTIGSSQGT